MGYVWQDLTDAAALITPISDNEYVLKGSLITPAAATVAAVSTRSSCSFSPVFFSPSAATAVTAVYLSPLAGTGPTEARPPETPQAEKAVSRDEVSPKPPPQVDDKDRRGHSVPRPNHSDTSTQTTGCRAAAVEHIGPLHAGPETGSPPQVSDCGACEIVEEDEAESGGEEKKNAPTNASYYTLLPGRERRSYTWCGVAGGRASHAFRNFLRCGAVAAEVNDSALLPINSCRRGQLRIGGGKYGSAGSCKGGGKAVVLSGKSRRSPTEGGARKSRGGGKSSSTSRAGEAAAEQKNMTVTVPKEAYKAAAEPSCSQCGRPFKPQRLHSHMKSCRALKGQKKNLSRGKLPKKVDSYDKKLSNEASSLFTPKPLTAL